MYQELFSADVVIADISTANANAFYELGLRHALRKRTTIIISEEQLGYPFDLNHVLINKYTHLGDSIDYFEVLRFQKLLGETLDSVLEKEEPDSPIYNFLNGLVPPSLQEKAADLANEVNEALEHAERPVVPADDNQTMSILVKQAEDAMSHKQYSLAKSFFNAALQMYNSGFEKNQSGVDPYLVHRYAYATYKAKDPDTITALTDSIKVLSALDLEHTNDAETVILAGRIEKQLYFNNQGDHHLANAVLYFERGNFLLNNRFNGINLAFLLNLRVETNLFTTREDKIADTVVASRIRRSIINKCDHEWMQYAQKEVEHNSVSKMNNALALSQQVEEIKEKFWIMVNKAEAHFGLGEMDNYRVAVTTAEALHHEPWMMKAFTDQLDKLRLLLREHGQSLNPAWKED
jgi:hypothetical protein